MRCVVSFTTVIVGVKTSVLLDFCSFWQAKKRRIAVKIINGGVFNVGEVLNLADVLRKYLLFIKRVDKIRIGLLNLAKIDILKDVNEKNTEGVFRKSQNLLLAFGCISNVFQGVLSSNCKYSTQMQPKLMDTCYFCALK